ncbi:uroporphyrinogen-III C-methyltransferase [Pseudidiomarina donghaiensis]|uniref:Heme biosynthesis operon protein HemX n=1 Tax=Pseudidiomarina donghaiensis TaxID=519452 RepID=A0A432XHZ7_9GAMM|nr:uroporphyrinogen-III C-methyltransferase [Pseudidiomarina donghaiensis]RUO48310.1 hypothetical protein CWE24_05875 [Pseudidiomarina donghaiensis]SFV24402.1 conserved protein HemX [Pseudidiomarina donghaiensis]
MSESTSNELEQQESSTPVADHDDTATKSPVSATATKSRSSSLVPWLVVLILLLVIAAAGWFGYRHLVPMHTQHQQALENLRNEQTATQAELEQLQQALESTSGQVNEQLEQALSAQEQQLRQQLQAQQSQLADYRLAVESVQAELANLDMSQESNWRIFEAHELTGRAATKLWIEQDPQASLAFLRLAQSHLVALNNPAHMAARQALANDIAALEQLPEAQVTDVSLTLGALRDRISRSTWYQQLAMTDKEQAPTADDTWLANLKRSANTLLQQFVRVQRRDTPVEPLIADAYFDVVQQRLLLQLQLAQQAAMQGEQTLFETTLEEAINQLQVLEGQITDTSITDVVKQLTELSQVTLRPDYPTQLEATNQLERLVRQQNVGG